MEKIFTFTAAGDSFITRRLSKPYNKSFTSLREIIGQGDFRFTNFEVTTPGKERMPSAVSGGTWASAHPMVIQDIQAYGFNCVAWANNHTLDYLYTGLEKTKAYLDKAGLVHAGAGVHLRDASAPRYIDLPHGRVALIALTTTFHETWIAGNNRPDDQGRPGVNGLRITKQFFTDAESIQQLKKIAEQIDINAQRNLDILEGFLPEDAPDEVVFGSYRFVEGQEPGQKRTPNELDVKRIIATIHEAKRQADYVVVSIHSHEMQGENKQRPADFVETLSRLFIDEGAHAVLGHGPHILRGIEIYKKRPIFYSLGNFIFQNDTVEALPADFYEKYNLPSDSNVADALDTRSRGNTVGLGVNPLVWESIIPMWKMKQGELVELKLYPIELGFGQERYQRGWPALSTKDSILQCIQALSEPYGVKIHIKDHIGIVEL